MTDATTEVRDLLPAWALDAVDDDERARVETAIRRDAALAHEARALVEPAARIGTPRAEPPPARLRARVLAAARDTPQRPPVARPAVAPRGSSPAARRRSRAAIGVAAGAVATMAVIAPSVLAVQQAGRAQRSELQLATVTEALGRPGAEVLTGELEGGGSAVAVLTERGAVFVARGLPGLADALAYQLWITADGEPRSAGVLDVAGGFVLVETRGAVPGNTLTLTVEPVDGSPQPTTEPVVVLPPPAPEGGEP